MKICILDGSQAEDSMAVRVQKLLAPLLVGHEVQHFVIREMKIAPCLGDFLCWTKKPGICKNKDDNLLIAEAMVQSELLILLTAVTFGGYSSLLKRGIDHLIQNVSPFFAKVQGETHHKKRYERYPNFAVIGWDKKPNPHSEEIFRHLVGRNSINLYAEKTYCEIFHPENTDKQLKQKIRGIIDGSIKQLEQTPLPKANIDARPAEQTQTSIKKALLLVGSPRKERSSSLSLGTYLCSKLEKLTMETETLSLYATDTKKNLEKTFATIQKKDLVILAFPLYVDSLPSPVIEFLERLADYRIMHKTEKATGFVALANCGFPEATHNDTALAIVEQFAKEGDFLWKGGIGIGNGNDLGSRPLEEGKRNTLAIRMALDLGAEALAKGGAIAQGSVDMAKKELYPSMFFRFFAQFFWKAAAAKHEVRKNIQDRPYSI